MRPDRGRGNRGLFAVLSVLAALTLIVEAFAALLLAHGGTMAVDFGAAVAAAAPTAAPGPAAPAEASAVSSGQRGGTVGSSSSQPAAAGQQPVRPRIRFAPPRLALWPAPTVLATPAPVAAFNADEGRVSAAFVDGYLEQKDSPLVGLGMEFWGRGRQYNVDPRLLVAIAGNETGFGRILTSRYNPFNWFYRGMWDSHFESWPEAIEAVARGIRRHYLDEGRTTVATLGAKYGPIGAANDPLNLNVNFIPNVTAFLREMGGDPEHLTFE